MGSTKLRAELFSDHKPLEKGHPDGRGDHWGKSEDEAGRKKGTTRSRLGTFNWTR